MQHVVKPTANMAEIINDSALLTNPDISMKNNADSKKRTLQLLDLPLDILRTILKEVRQLSKAHVTTFN